MGSWGDGIYENDSALDFFYLYITERLNRELLYWFSPGKVSQSSRWLGEVFAVFEMILLFERHRKGTYIDIFIYENPVPRWREIFLSVWDGDWDETDVKYSRTYAYRNPEYRKEYRAVVLEIFDHFNLMNSADFDPELTSWKPDFPLPYFSIERGSHREQEYVAYTGKITREIISHLMMTIVYELAPEMHPHSMDFFNISCAVVSADVIAFLCELYEGSPGIPHEVVPNWHKQVIQIWKTRIDEEGEPEEDWDTTPFMQNIAQVFKHLETVAEKYPADWI